MRVHFIDNLRWVMILLVISQHASVTYNNQGLWYYNEPTQLNQLEQGVIITYVFFLQTFFMGILFFVAGYFAPGAYDRKGPRRFLKDRAWLIPTALGRRWGLLAILTGPPLFIVLAALGGALKGQTASYTGGWHWQSLALCVLEAFAGVGISLGCITLFRERFNRQGRLAAFFSANAFAVYVFHPPILIDITRAMTNLRIEVLLKFTIAAILCFAITNALAATVFRRIPLLKNIL